MTNDFAWRIGTAVSLMILSLGATGLPSVAQSARSTTEIEREIAQMDAQLATMSVGQARTLWSDKAIDIHGSGWLYTKSEVLNLDGQPPSRKVILREATPKKITVFNDDAVMETWVSTIYFEVPDPQEEARKLGTMLMDPARMRAVQEAMVHRPSFGPGESESPNPYRLRNVRLWVRESGKWRIGLSSSNRIGERVHPGAGSDAIVPPK